MGGDAKKPKDLIQLYQPEDRKHTYFHIAKAMVYDGCVPGCLQGY